MSPNLSYLPPTLRCISSNSLLNLGSCSLTPLRDPTGQIAVGGTNHRASRGYTGIVCPNVRGTQADELGECKYRFDRHLCWWRVVSDLLVRFRDAENLCRGGGRILKPMIPGKEASLHRRNVPPSRPSQSTLASSCATFGLLNCIRKCFRRLLRNGHG